MKAAFIPLPLLHDRLSGDQTPTRGRHDDLVALGHEHSLLQRGQGTALHNFAVYQPEIFTGHPLENNRPQIPIDRAGNRGGGSATPHARACGRGKKSSIPSGGDTSKARYRGCVSGLALYPEAYEIRLLLRRRKRRMEWAKRLFRECWSRSPSARPRRVAGAGGSNELMRSAAPQVMMRLVVLLGPRRCRCRACIHEPSSRGLGVTLTGC